MDANILLAELRKKHELIMAAYTEDTVANGPDRSVQSIILRAVAGTLDGVIEAVEKAVAGTK